MKFLSITFTLLLLQNHLRESHIIRDFEYSKEEDINDEAFEEESRWNASENHDTAPLNPEVVKRIKADILNKLGLKEEPKGLHPKPPLQSIKSPTSVTGQNLIITRNKSKSQDLQSFAVFSEIDLKNVSVDGVLHSVRFSFNLSNGISFENQVLHELWIFKNNTLDSFDLVHLSRESDDGGDFFQIRNQRDFKGWLRFDVSSLVQSSLSKGAWHFELQASCSQACPESFISTNSEQKPFMITFHNSPKQRSREKRSSVDCREGPSSATCCRERLYIPFEIIGFDSWILEPEGYEANYCRGSCHNNIELIKFPHGNVILNFIKANLTVAENMGVKISCVPSEMSGLPFIHLNENGIYVEKNMPNMVVETCECS